MPVPQLTEEPSGVYLELSEGLCSDGAVIGRVMAARVRTANLMSGSTSIPGGLFAHVALRDVDPANGTFHFDVLDLIALSHEMTIRGSARSAPALVSGSAGVCLSRGATLLAAIEHDVARFESASRLAELRRASP